MRAIFPARLRQRCPRWRCPRQRLLLLSFWSLLVMASPSWARIAVPFFPSGETSKAVIGFSWDSSPEDYSYFLQVEDASSGAVIFGDYVHRSIFDLSLAPGQYRWRVEVLTDSSTHGGFCDWTDFTVASTAPAVEDLLGTSPIATTAPLETQLRFPASAWRDSDGSLLIADTQHSVVKQVIAGVAKVIAGNGIQGYNGDGSALQVELNQPTMALDDGSGNIYIFDAGNFLVRKLDSSGQITTVAGVAGNRGYLAADKSLQDARLGYISCATRRGGVIYVAMNFVEQWRGSTDYLDVASVFVFNGGGFTPYGPLTGLSLVDITGFDTVDGVDWVIDGGSSGSLYRVAGGIATNVAANMTYPDGLLAVDEETAYVGDESSILLYSNGNRTLLGGNFVHVAGIEADAGGELLVTDSDSQQVIDFNTTAQKNTFLAGGSGPFSSIAALARLDANHLAILNGSPGGIYSYDIRDGATTRLVGNGYNDYPSLGPGTRSSLYFPTGLAVDAGGNIYWSESNAIYQYSQQTGLISIISGQPFRSGYADQTDLLDATFGCPVDLAVDAKGRILVADMCNNAVRLVDPINNFVQTVGDVNRVAGVTAYSDGAYVSSYWENDIQFCFYDSHDGSGCSVVAGVSDPQATQGLGGFVDGARLSAKFNSPSGLATIEGEPNLIVADQFNNRLRCVNSSTVTLVGDGSEGYGPNQLNLPSHAIELGGNVYIADTGNGLLRVTTPSAGTCL